MQPGQFSKKYRTMKAIFFAAVFRFTAPVFAQCPADSTELAKFFNQMNGPNWSQPWDLGQPMKTWAGVLVNADGCAESVILLDKLRGILPDLDLPNLKKLTLAATWPADSTLITSLPDFGKMPILAEMTISNLAAAPPGASFPDFSHLPLLKNLSLSANRFTGSLTDFSHLPALENVQFANSLATGPVPDFQHLSNLRSLKIIESAVTAVPDFQKMPMLETVQIRGTSLAGPVPDFQHLPNLRELDLGGTKVLGDVFPADFTGPIPDFSKLANLEKLNLVFLTTKTDIPDFSKLPALKSLAITGVELEGTLPDFHFLPNLESIYIGGWREWFVFIPEQPRPSKIAGPLPDFSNLPNLKSMELGLNRLTGAPPDFSNLPKIQWINLNTNLLTGIIPAFASLPASVQYINLNSNNLSSFAGLATTAGVSVAYNELTFEDLLPEFAKLDDYFQQDSVAVQPLYFLNGNSLMEIDLVFDKNVAGSTYKWFKNGILLATTASNNLELTAPALPTDRFRVAVTNPGAPDLLLVTKVFAVGGLAPEVDFEVQITPGCSLTNFPAFVKFTGPADPASLVSIQWEFPGGQPASSTFANPLTTYAMPGSYQVTLTAANLFGSDQVFKTILVNFDDPADATFLVEKTGLTVTCTAVDTAAQSYFWQFGDGATDIVSGWAVQHTYAANGVFNVQLFLSNTCNGDSETQSVGVTGVVGPALSPAIFIVPNPSNGHFLVEMQLPGFDAEQFSVALFGPLGQCISTKMGTAKNELLQFEFDETGLPGGVYFLKIKNGLGVFGRRVIVLGE